MMKGYRTVAFNVLSMMVPILSLPEFHGVVPVEYLPFWMLFVAVANVTLRMITTTPVGKK